MKDKALMKYLQNQQIENLVDVIALIKEANQKGELTIEIPPNPNEEQEARLGEWLTEQGFSTWLVSPPKEDGRYYREINWRFRLSLGQRQKRIRD